MGLNTALVDRARRVMELPTGERVEGTTQFVTYHSPWFKCRLTLEPAPETGDEHAGRTRTRRQAQLMTGVKDKDGGPVVINSMDRIEVDSKALGRALYQLTSDGEPIRKKRKQIGWTATLTHLDEHQFQRPEP